MVFFFFFIFLGALASTGRAADSAPAVDAFVDDCGCNGSTVSVASGMDAAAKRCKSANEETPVGMLGMSAGVGRAVELALELTVELELEVED